MALAERIPLQNPEATTAEAEKLSVERRAKIIRDFLVELVPILPGRYLEFDKKVEVNQKTILIQAYKDVAIEVPLRKVGLFEAVSIIRQLEKDHGIKLHTAEVNSAHLPALDTEVLLQPETLALLSGKSYGLLVKILERRGIVREKEVLEKIPNAQRSAKILMALPKILDQREEGYDYLNELVITIVDMPDLLLYIPKKLRNALLHRINFETFASFVSDTAFQRKNVLFAQETIKTSGDFKKNDFKTNQALVYSIIKHLSDFLKPGQNFSFKDLEEMRTSFPEITSLQGEFPDETTFENYKREIGPNNLVQRLIRDILSLIPDAVESNATIRHIVKDELEKISEFAPPIRIVETGKLSIVDVLKNPGILLDLPKQEALSFLKSMTQSTQSVQTDTSKMKNEEAAYDYVADILASKDARPIENKEEAKDIVIKAWLLWKQVPLWENLLTLIENVIEQFCQENITAPDVPDDTIKLLR